MPKVPPRFVRRGSHGAKIYNYHAPAIAAVGAFDAVSPRRVSFDDALGTNTYEADGGQAKASASRSTLTGSAPEEKLTRKSSLTRSRKSSLIRPITSQCLADLASQCGVNDEVTQNTTNPSPSPLADGTASRASLAFGSAQALSNHPHRTAPAPVSPLASHRAEVTPPFLASSSQEEDGAPSLRRQLPQSSRGQRTRRRQPASSPSEWGQFVDMTKSGDENDEPPSMDDDLLVAERQSYVPCISYASIRQRRRACPYQKMASNSRPKCHLPNASGRYPLPMLPESTGKVQPTGPPSPNFVTPHLAVSLPNSITSLSPRKEDRSHVSGSKRGVAEQLSAALNFLRVD